MKDVHETDMRHEVLKLLYTHGVSPNEMYAPYTPESQA